jgi:hypothetical protein
LKADDDVLRVARRRNAAKKRSIGRPTIRPDSQPRALEASRHAPVGEELHRRPEPVLRVADELVATVKSRDLLAADRLWQLLVGDVALDEHPAARYRHRAHLVERMKRVPYVIEDTEQGRHVEAASAPYG